MKIAQRLLDNAMCVCEDYKELNCMIKRDCVGGTIYLLRRNLRSFFLMILRDIGKYRVFGV